MFQGIDKPNGEFSQRKDIKIMKIKIEQKFQK